jgi:hypothetical protein
MEAVMTTDTADRPLHRWEIVIALLAVIAALGFNAWQTSIGTDAVRLQTAALEAQTKSLDAQRKAFEAQVWQMINQQQLELGKVLIDNPKLLPYFARNKQINPSHRDFDLVMAVADLYLDFFDGFHDDYVRSLPGMGEKGKYWVVWQKYFEDSFALSSALCTRLAGVREWYTEDIAKYAQKSCMKASFQLGPRSAQLGKPNRAQVPQPIRLF